MPAKPLTNQQIEDAKTLKKIFREWQSDCQKKGAKVSQESAAERLGFGQSALSQYLNGGIPLNLDAAIRFAKLLNVPISAFSKDLANQAENYAAQANHSLNAADSGDRQDYDAMIDVAQLIDAFAKIPAEKRSFVITFAQQMAKFNNGSAIQEGGATGVGGIIRRRS
jgi:transcriptional regulator with XRE-family HTH domain